MAKVIFQESGVEAEWTGEQDSLLEFGEEHGLDLDFGCRMGNCTACQQKIVVGEVSYPDGHGGEPEAGNALLCCSVPKGDTDLVIGA
jgi:ferredoxin